MSERVCVIHIGTHKTGTTSQQLFLATNWPELKQKGTLYVTAGWLRHLTGNHELAWDLLRSDESPHLSEAVAELRASDAHTAIMSAEDLSMLYSRPQAIETLAAAVRSAGFVPKVLVYLRAQPTYAESHYVERVKQGHIVPLKSYLEQILGEGRYAQPDSDIRLEFDYARLLAPFLEILGRENVMVRVFKANQAVGHVFQDFTQALALLSPAFAATPFSLRVKHPRENDSLSFYQLLATAQMQLAPEEYERYKDEPLAFRDAFAADVSPVFLDSRYSLLSREEWLALLDRFGTQNVSIGNEFGAEIPFRTSVDIPPPNDERWLKAELERAVYDRNIAAWLRKRDANPPASE